MEGFGFFKEDHDYLLVRANETIFRSGDSGAAMYILIEGEVSISIDGHEIDHLLAGSPFGEMALVDQQQRSATATAVTDCKLLEIDEAHFADLSQTYPRFGLEVMRIMSHRTRRLLVEEAKKIRMEEELAIGRDIQLGLLPKETPEVPGWAFAALYRSAREVGGDLYDFIPAAYSNHVFNIVVADVTGKGVPAALFMASIRSVIRTLSLNETTPANILRLSNRAIVQDMRTPLFLSAVLAQLDAQSGAVTLSNAGHERPLWVRPSLDHVEAIKIPGMLLGAFTEIRPSQETITLARGETLILYTDGVTEARSATGELFDDERLMETARRHQRASASEIAQQIDTAVVDFTGDTPQSDDLTLVVIKRT